MRSVCISSLAALAISASAIAETHTVLANNTSFSPDAIDVAAGDTIIWQYNSGYPHTVTSGVACTADGLFFSELNSGNPTFTWEVPLEASGDIPYFCEPHCSMGMDGIITVVDGPAVLHVPTDEYPTIQSAIDAASDGDTIAIAAGIYYEHSLTIGDFASSLHLTVIGETFTDGTPAVTIDAQQQGRVFTLNGNQDSEFVLANLIITGGGNVYMGGGVASSGSHTFENCTLINNTAYMDGGAMTNEGFGKGSYSYPTFIGCQFIGNSALDGGAMKNGYSNTRLIDCIVTDNTAQDGGENGGAGGIDNSGGSVSSLTNTIVCGNWPTQIDGNWIDKDGSTVEDICPNDCPGDVDGNGEVGVDDLLWLLGEYGADCSGGCDSDLDGNGEVDVNDLLAMLSYYGDDCN